MNLAGRLALCRIHFEHTQDNGLNEEPWHDECEEEAEEVLAAGQQTSCQCKHREELAPIQFLEGQLAR